MAVLASPRIDGAVVDDGIPALLTRHLGLLEEALRRSALPRTSALGRMAGYHMGWVHADGRPASGSSGKLVRPALCLWACEACGGTAGQAVQAAVAVELVHNFTLVHDDIQDGDLQRRHRPTVWSIWGSSQGINTGDGLFALAYRTLLGRGVPAARGMRAARAVTDGILDVIEGQCLDLTLEGRPDTAVATYLRLVRSKTGALLGAALEAGAIMAGAPAAHSRRFRSAGRLLGLAFQMRDDWLGVWGDPALTGKGRDGDLARRKLTYPVVAAYAQASPAQRHELRRLYRDPDAPSGEERIRSILVELGGPGLTEDVAPSLACDAVAALSGCRLSDPAVHEFAELAIYVAERLR